MVDNVLLSEFDEPHIPDHIDVSFRCIQRDEFGSFPDPERRSVDPGRLTPDVINRCKPVKQNLSYDD